MRKSIVEQATGKVLNIIEIEKDAKWSPPEGCALMDGGEIGDIWDGTKFVYQESPLSIPPRDLAAELDNLKAELKSKGVIS